MNPSQPNHIDLVPTEAGPYVTERVELPTEVQGSPVHIQSYDFTVSAHVHEARAFGKAFAQYLGGILGPKA